MKHIWIWIFEYFSPLLHHQIVYELKITSLHATAVCNNIHLYNSCLYLQLFPVLDMQSSTFYVNEVIEFKNNSPINPFNLV